ncbi:PD40 domain-containing protein [Candidatus Wolfebacteria bacterium]|nr:PD40 domain-containing protein [Candidatus Wolfebacteria bacterium]
MKNGFKWKKILLVTGSIIGCLLILYIVFFIVVLYRANVNPVRENWKSTGSFSSSFHPAGKIYLTLQSGKLFRGNLGIYEFDLNSKQNKEFLVGKYDNFTLDFSSDGVKKVFVSNSPGGDIDNLFVNEGENSKSKQITFSSTTRKYYPLFSPDGNQIVFILSAKAYLPFPDDKRVYITDMNGNERFIISGTNPLFSPNGEDLLVLKNDGLYLVNINNKQSSRVIISPSGKVYPSMKLSLSKNYQMLAWSDARNGEVTVFKITNWKPFSYSIYKKIPIKAFGLTFSPDNRYLALHEAKLNNRKNVPPSQSRLVIYDLETMEWQEVADLSDYNQTQMWITDWQP